VAIVESKMGRWKARMGGWENVDWGKSTGTRNVAQKNFVSRYGAEKRGTMPVL